MFEYLTMRQKRDTITFLELCAKKGLDINSSMDLLKKEVAQYDYEKPHTYIRCEKCGSRMSVLDSYTGELTRITKDTEEYIIYCKSCRYSKYISNSEVS